MPHRLLLLALVAFLFHNQSVNAQVYSSGPPPVPMKRTVSDTKLSITPFYGYNFDETFQIDYGSVYLEQGSVYGVSLAKDVTDWAEFEGTWQHQVTNATGSLYYTYGQNWYENNIPSELAIDYFMLGMNAIKHPDERISLYGGLSAGIVVFTPRTLDIAATVRFAVAAKAGVKIKVTELIGIKLQPQLYIPIQSLGASVFVGSGGSSVGVSGYSTITQFGGIAGLSLSF